MSNPFFDAPILTSPYGYPACHWELDGEGLPTQQVIERRRPAQFITPIPKPRKRKRGQTNQQTLVFDEHGNPLLRLNPLLIDSEQLESGEALDDNFRSMAVDEIARFRREGRLGAGVRCVVSVAMLTEGWDANTVTHVLGVRSTATAA